MNILRKTKRERSKEEATEESVYENLMKQIDAISLQLVRDDVAQNYDEGRVLITEALSDISIRKTIRKSAHARIKHKKIGFTYGERSIFKNINENIIN